MRPVDVDGSGSSSSSFSIALVLELRRVSVHPTPMGGTRRRATKSATVSGIKYLNEQ